MTERKEPAFPERVLVAIPLPGELVKPTPWIVRSRHDDTERPHTVDEYLSLQEHNHIVDALEAKVQRLQEALRFYTKIENFGVTVWEDETQDGRCWYEPAKDHGLGEIYGPNDTGDFGIKAMEALDEWDEALQDPAAREGNDE